VQWIDREGKTPLIVACMNPELHNVAKTLIELGANVNAYRPGTFFFSFSFPFLLWICMYVSSYN
jgi:ankyrin repeat protein